MHLRIWCEVLYLLPSQLRLKLSDAVIGNFVQVERASIFELGLVAEIFRYTKVYSELYRNVA